jgi:hypothetical protein
MEYMADKKVALISGANKGLGFEMARQLAQVELPSSLPLVIPGKAKPRRRNCVARGWTFNF